MTDVLLVDDSPEMRHLVRELLEDEGYFVITTPTAETALEALRASENGAVVLFGMRVGTTLLQTAVDEPALQRHAFVLLTATPEHLTPAWRVLLRALDVPVVVKPFALDTLLAAVADAAARIGRHDGQPIPA